MITYTLIYVEDNKDLTLESGVEIISGQSFAKLKGEARVDMKSNVGRTPFKYFVKARGSDNLFDVKEMKEITFESKR